MLGQLLVKLGLDAVDFTSGLSKSELQAKRFGQTMDRAVATGVIKAQVAIMALGAAIRGTAAAFQTLTSGAGQYQDFAEMIGGSAEEVASLAVAAATAGVEMGSVVTAANRLTKGMVGVDEESSKVRAGLNALNINISEFKKLSAVEQYEAVGKALTGMAVSADRSAIAQDILGKAGAEQIKVFVALQEAGGRQTILTQRQIELADKYADAQSKAGAELRLYAQAAASEAVPALVDLTRAVTSVIKEMLGVDKAGKLISGGGNVVKEFAKSAADAVAFLADAAVMSGRIVSATISGIVAAYKSASAILTAVDKTGPRSILSGGIFNSDNRAAITAAFAEAEKYTNDADQKFSNIVEKDAAGFRNALAASRAQSGGRPANEGGGGLRSRDKPKAPRYTGVPDTGAANAREALLKKELDGEIKAIRDFAEQQRDALNFANSYAKGAYDAGEMSLAKFYENERLIRAAALQVTVSALDEEIAVLRRAATRSVKPEERVDAENKIAEAVAKRSAAVLDAGYKTALAGQEEASSIAQLKGRYDDLRLTILQLSGDTAKAARERIDQQVSEAQSLIKNVGGDPAEADRYRQLLTDTEALSKARQDYNRLLETTRNNEDSIYLAAQEGGKSEIETLRALGSSRSATLTQMAEMVQRANELAAALKTDDAIQFAEQLSAAFKRATAEVDPLLMKIRDVGAEAASTIANGLEDAVLSGKNLKDVLKDLDKQLAQIAYRQLVTKPFEQWLSGAMGGNGQTSGGGGWIGAAGSLIAGMFGAGGGGGGTNGFGIGVSGAAIGGPVMPRSMRRVAENGPEVFNDGSNQYLLAGSRGGSINPNPGIGSRTINAPVYITVPGNTDRRTASQIGSNVARQLAVANARLN